MIINLAKLAHEQRTHPVRLKTEIDHFLLWPNPQYGKRSPPVPFLALMLSFTAWIKCTVCDRWACASSNWAAAPGGEGHIMTFAIMCLLYLRNSSRSIVEDPTLLQDQDLAWSAAACCGSCSLILCYPLLWKLADQQGVLATFCQLFAWIVPVDVLSWTLPDTDNGKLCLNSLLP